MNDRKVDIKPTFGGGHKDKSGKARLDLVPPSVLIAIANSLESGEQKGYPNHNWFKGIPNMDAYAALMRHIIAWHEGEDEFTDTLKDGTKITGRHSECMMFNAMNIFLNDYYKRARLDDRWVKKQLDKDKEG